MQPSNPRNPDGVPAYPAPTKAENPEGPTRSLTRHGFLTQGSAQSQGRDEEVIEESRCHTRRPGSR